jgi:tRNA pseudouridine55 synthase
MALRGNNRRNVNGILLLDKPAGLSSNDALQVVKRLYNARKAGHTGSLDPLATGLLVICLGEATKVSAYLLEADKRYLTTCRLGVKTATADAEGAITQTRPIEPYSATRIGHVLHEFRGRINQIPPMYSAVKHQGERLYKLARNGVKVSREPRQVAIHELELVDRGSDTLTLGISCSKGTYVRTLIEDIGEALGCGAHVMALRRLGVAPFDAPDMIELEDLSELAEQAPDALERRLLPMDSALVGWPELNVDEICESYLKTGQAIQIPGAPLKGKMRLYDRRHEFIGLARVLDDGRVAPERTIRLR